MQHEQTEKYSKSEWSFTCHLDFGDSSAACTIKKNSSGLSINPVENIQSRSDDDYPPVFLGISMAGQVIVMDPVSKAINYIGGYPQNAFAPYAYRDPASEHVWFMYDGDKKTGCDELNCGSNGSSVTVISSTGAPSSNAALLALICVGRGHHVTTFTAPNDAFPDIPRHAFVSNLQDGTISVIGNDPDNKENYLKVLDTINLCEPDKEKEGNTVIPNNAFPHGKMFSGHTGKIYSLNNGYGTVAVINPVTNTIEKTFELKVSSNLLLSPDGRFLIGKGADRKSDQNHVQGRLTVMDALSGNIEKTLDLKDIYPSTYRFTPDGKKLYVTSAATGQGEQRDNLKKKSVYVYDASALPELTLASEIVVGVADCSRRPLAFATHNNGTQTAFIPNPTDGTISIIDVADDSVIDTVRICDKPVKEFNFSFWDGAISGC